jgi:protein ImuB
MPRRRALSLWFPRLAAERLLRRDPAAPSAPFAVVAEEARVQRLASLSAEAEVAGLIRGQPLRDARAMCPALLTRPADPLAEAAFLSALRRWAGRFSPWVAEEPPEALLLDITGCAHLFGGEAVLLTQLVQECADLGLSVRAAVADTPGAAWAVARYGGHRPLHPLSGDAVRQEARATRARAAPARRSPSPIDAPTSGSTSGSLCGRIVPSGQTRTALGPLPLAALRLPSETVTQLARLGLRRVDDLLGLPRAALARRYGREVMRRLDQALGLEPEPISPAGVPLHFAVRLTLPEPIGLEADLLAGIDRMLPRLCARLVEAGRGARRLRLQAFRADGGLSLTEVGLARPTAEPDRIRPLLAMGFDRIEAGFGIDMLRLEAHVTEPVHAGRHRGHLDASMAAATRQAEGRDRFDDLIGRLGARVGLEAITRLHPGDSHIPEKSVQILAAAWSEPAANWPVPASPRPLLLLRWPELVMAPDRPAPPERLRWRRRELCIAGATGPERVAPEWWLDDPAWRSGLRDYWCMETREGARLWLAYAHGGEVSGGWFCHGVFA